MSKGKIWFFCLTAGQRPGNGRNGGRVGGARFRPWDVCFRPLFFRFWHVFLCARPNISIDISTNISIDIFSDMPRGGVVSLRDYAGGNFRHIQRIYQFQFTFHSWSISHNLV